MNNPPFAVLLTVAVLSNATSAMAQTRTSQSFMSSEPTAPGAARVTTAAGQPQSSGQQPADYLTPNVIKIMGECALQRAQLQGVVEGLAARLEAETKRADDAEAKLKAADKSPEAAKP